MSILAKLQNNPVIETADKDFVGSGKFTLDSNVYPATVKVAYLDEYASGAIFVAFEFSVETKGTQKTYKENICISNKAGSLTYVGKDGTPQAMPGYVLVDTLCKLASGKALFELGTEQKMVKVWNKEQRAEVPTNKEVITGLIGTTLVLGILEEEYNHYNEEKARAGETQLKNRIAKVFNSKGQTQSELITEAAPAFINSWIEKNANQVIDKKEKVTTTPTINAQQSPFAQPTAPVQQPQAQADASVKPLFG